MKKGIHFKIKTWLRKPFPFYSSYKQKIFIPLFFSLVVMFGLLINNWSSNNEILMEEIKSILIYGSIVMGISIFYSLVFPELFPKVFNKENWNLSKMLFFILLSVLSVVIAISISVYFFDNPKNIKYIEILLSIITRSVVLSFFPIVIILFYFENSLYKKNRNEALLIKNKIVGNKNITNVQNVYCTFGKNTKDEIQILENDIYYIKAEGNYCSIFYESNSVQFRKVIRCSMKEIENALMPSLNFIRCHKSFIINLSKVSNVHGNARGYVFQFSTLKNTIPGSRNLSKSLISKIKETQKTSH